MGCTQVSGVNVHGAVSVVSFHSRVWALICTWRVPLLHVPAPVPLHGVSVQDSLRALAQLFKADIDAGNLSFDPAADQSGAPYTSGPQWLSGHVLHHPTHHATGPRHVLAVAGTHGKTTTTAMLTWILEQAGLQPGFLIGGVPMNFGVSARLGAPTLPASRGSLPPEGAELGLGRPGAAFTGDTAIVITEHDWKLSLDVAEGHKTGFYLDQRDSRHKFAAYAKRLQFQNVLNCYCYTGGFTVAALAGGAAHVTSIDSSGPAIERAKANVALNGFEGSPSIITVTTPKRSFVVAVCSGSSRRGS